MIEQKLETIEMLPPLSSLKNIWIFLGHVGFSQRFIKYFSKISKLLCNLLEKNLVFKFDNSCLEAYTILKQKLVSTPIIVASDWTLPFELMCNASNFAVGTALGKHKEKIFHTIYYASKMLNDAQLNYTTTENELLAIVFAFNKFHSYLISAKVVVYTDHSTIK